MIRHRLSLEEFQALLEKAPEGLRLELLDGEVYEMAPIGSGHASLVTYLAKQLERLYGDRALVYVQNPLRLSPHSLPQPDLALLRPREDFYRERLPEAGDTLLVVEVSFSPGKWTLRSSPSTPKEASPRCGSWRKGEAWRCTGSPGAPVTATASLWSPGRRWPPPPLPSPSPLGPPRGTPPA